jgi:hypothetical protein
VTGAGRFCSFVRLESVCNAKVSIYVCLFSLAGYDMPIVSQHGKINVPLCPPGAIAPPYSSGDLVRLVPRGLGCESRFGAIVEAVDKY